MGRHPALDEAGGILGEILVKLPLSVGVVDLLDYDCEIVVCSNDCFQIIDVGFRGLEFLKLGEEQVREWHADVVDCGRRGWDRSFCIRSGRASDIRLVHSDGVW